MEPAKINRMGGKSRDRERGRERGRRRKRERESTDGRSISRQFSTGQYHCKLRTFLRVRRALTFPRTPLL